MISPVECVRCGPGCKRAHHGWAAPRWLLWPAGFAVAATRYLAGGGGLRAPPLDDHRVVPDMVPDMVPDLTQGGQRKLKHFAPGVRQLETGGGGAGGGRGGTLMKCCVTAMEWVDVLRLGMRAPRKQR